MEKEKANKGLNSLITINNDRIEGYKTASKETEEPDLKTLFAKSISTSQKGTKTSGKFFRAWMDVKAALRGKDRKAILNSYEFGEDEKKRYL